MQQTPLDWVLTVVADRVGVCWLSVVLWKDGTFGTRLYLPITKCKRSCNYCGKYYIEAK